MPGGKEPNILAAHNSYTIDELLRELGQRGKAYIGRGDSVESSG